MSDQWFGNFHCRGFSLRQISAENRQRHAAVNKSTDNPPDDGARARVHPAEFALDCGQCKRRL
jgi:hypothetical protein